MTDNALALAQSALTAINSLQTQVAVLSGQIHAQGGTVTPQGQAITKITNTITSEAGARASADDALATRAGAFSCNLDSCRPIPEDAAASATSFLTARVTSAEESTLAVDPGQAVEPLRLGKVTFYGESARVIRAAQAVLQAAGAGQLEVVKRVRRGEHTFPLVNGQIFFPKDYIEYEAREICKEAKLAQPEGSASEPGEPPLFDVDREGNQYAAGIKLGVQLEKPKVIIARELLDEIQKQISESSLGNELAKRVEDLEKSRSQILADAKREVAESILRDLDRDKCNATLGGLKQRFQGSDGPSFCGWPGASLAAGAVEPLIARVAQQPKPE